MRQKGVKKLILTALIVGAVTISILPPVSALKGAINRFKETNNEVTSVVIKVNENVITVDGEEQRLSPNNKVVALLKNNSIYIPARAIADVFGATSSYKNGIYTIISGKRVTKFNTYTNKAYCNGKLASSAIDAFYNEGALYLPAGILGKGLNKSLKRDGDTLTIGKVDNSLSVTEEVQIPVLMYHHFDSEVQTGLIADPKVFEEQMKLLKAEGYTTLTTQDIIAISKGEQEMPKKPLMITLDDGYKSNYDVVYPVLKKLNMKATIFIITDFIENPEKHPSQYPKMTWDMIKEMSDSGLVSFQSHTDNMHCVRGEICGITQPIEVNGELETTSEYEERVKKDLIRSKQLLEEKLGKPVTSFAYPMGKYTESAEKLLKEAGFELTLTTDVGLYNTKRDTLYLMKRVNIHGKASAESVLDTIEKMRNL